MQNEAPIITPPEKEKKKSINQIQTKYYNCIIEKWNKENEKEINLRELKEILNLHTYFFALILHDKDLKADQEIETREHYHIVMVLKDKKRLTSVINLLTKETNINDNMITINKMENLMYSTQYLIHKNQKNKHQYPEFLIETNRRQKLITLLNTKIDYDELTANELIEICGRYRNKIKILLEIGLKNYNKYARVIDMILENDFSFHSIDEQVKEYYKSN